MIYVLSFVQQGKDKAWSAWDIMGDERTRTVILITENPLSFTIESYAMNVLERFIILQYDPKSRCQMLVEGRREMFLKQFKSLDAIPPTKHGISAYQTLHTAQ